MTLRIHNPFDATRPGAIGGTTPGSGAFTTLSASGLISANGGQVAFPATQSASSDPNTLDDYEEGTFTPVLTFATPGDFSVTYSQQKGIYTKVGRRVFYAVNIITSAFTFTTASGNMLVTGLPFTSANVTQEFYVGTANLGGVTKAGYTQFVPVVVANVTQMQVNANGSGVSTSAVAAADTPTGGTVTLRLTGEYHV